MSEQQRVITVADGSPRIVADDWRLLDAGAEWDGSAGVLLPLAVALTRPDRLRAAGRIGIWLAPTDDPAQALPLLSLVTLIGVHFPKFTDGRGYSTAYLLRNRLGWQGELRALGDILQDQLFALRRVGFDSFALRADRDPGAALRAFATFGDSYQGSVDQALPFFRRSAGAAQ